jgi:hypothetical protein
MDSPGGHPHRDPAEGVIDARKVDGLLKAVGLGQFVMAGPEFQSILEANGVPEALVHLGALLEPLGEDQGVQILQCESGAPLGWIGIPPHGKTVVPLLIVEGQVLPQLVELIVFDVLRSRLQCSTDALLMQPGKVGDEAYLLFV